MNNFEKTKQKSLTVPRLQLTHKKVPHAHAKCHTLYANAQVRAKTHTTTGKQFIETSYPLGLPGPGLGGFQVTLISDEEMLRAFTSDGASLGSGKKQVKNGDNHEMPKAILCSFI